MIHLLESHRFPMTPTRIVHIDTAASPTAVDGIASNLWLLCTEQARRGLDVTLFSRLDADPELAQAEAAAGFRIIDTPHAPKATNIRAARAALDLVEPDLVHFHGSWQPHHGIMGRLVRRAGIPYVYAPYGGLSPVVLASRRRLRRIYMAAFEIPLARGAAGWAPSFETEIDELRAVAGPHWQGAQRVLSPPVPHDILDSGPSETDPDPRRVVFLGRYDIFQKGLDRLVGLAAELPEITFQLHGSVDSASAADVDSLRARAPGNVIFGDPVFGDGQGAGSRLGRCLHPALPIRGIPHVGCRSAVLRPSGHRVRRSRSRRGDHRSERGSGVAGGPRGRGSIDARLPHPPRRRLGGRP